MQAYIELATFMPNIANKNYKRNNIIDNYLVIVSVNGWKLY